MYAYGPFWNGFQWWWLIPIAMMVLCFFMMRGHGCMMGRSNYSRDESAKEILDKRFAKGEIGKEEYEDMKRRMSQ